jgi:hypothetical protein
MLITDPLFYVIAVPVVLLTGVSQSGRQDVPNAAIGVNGCG